jgi:cellulose synthase/poly-beta-1,6-N-acetylglucosamine synthase-like glycosyltransferase
VSTQPVDEYMAERRPSPPNAMSTAREVADWVRGLEEGFDDAAKAILREEIDGRTLVTYSTRLEVKQDLQITGGKAARLWEAIQGLQAGGNGSGLSQASPFGGGTTPGAQLGSSPQSGSPQSTKGPVLGEKNKELFRQTWPEAHPYEDDPQQTPKYFTHLRQNQDTAKKTIGICVPMYNEEMWGLDNTLNSLFNLKVPAGFTLDVIILMDGLAPIALSTKEYLKGLYGINWETFDARMKQTTIFESIKWYDPLDGKQVKTRGNHLVSNLFGAVEVSTQRQSRKDFRVSCLIKKKNYRKHNSHEWFMAAFGKELQATYLLCTDCATIYDEDMLVKLTDNLERNPRTTAVCGRQRVMSVKFQNTGTGKPLSNEFITAPLEYALRQVQTYDFEADHPVSKAVYDFLGFLPVLPGPCGLYRYADLQNGRYQAYFETVNKPAEECGLWLANLKIAEDRIPSLFAVFFSEQEEAEPHAFKTHWVRDAVFYFESEETLKSLVLQRRRWLNGTNAGCTFSDSGS